MASQWRHDNLVEGAIFASLTAVIAHLGLLVPPLFPLISVVIPLPLAVLVKKRDLVTGALALVVAAVLLLVFYGRPVTVMMLLIQLGPLGLLLGLLFKNRVRAGLAVAMAAGIAVILNVITLLSGFWFLGINPLAAGSGIYGDIEQLLAFYQHQGLIEPGMEDEIRHLLQEMVQLMTLLFPANLVLWSLVSTTITYYLGQVVLQRLGYVVETLPPFRQWQIPWYFVWIVITGLLLFLTGDALNKQSVAAAGKNLVYLGAFLYLVAGLSVLGFYFDRFQLSRAVRLILTVVLIVYWPFTVVALTILGLVDSLLNIRQAAQHRKKGGDDR
ncbi:YybS family protein [Desulfofundulus thermocisternus]|uniref:YybS family protein n=1 Tax=Desulfofundulus thermocisternus TaxID=42471 RepID=UPI0019D9DD60|nr:YybS family protein [Desulfofundulus thermocisternus]MBE3586751.1 YybS family protein [Thermoanaerobacter sp.]MCS5697029.1 YybS family protein [Desulfofundulus thermocisternus]